MPRPGRMRILSTRCPEIAWEMRARPPRSAAASPRATSSTSRSRSGARSGSATFVAWHQSGKEADPTAEVEMMKIGQEHLALEMDRRLSTPRARAKDKDVREARAGHAEDHIFSENDPKPKETLEATATQYRRHGHHGGRPRSLGHRRFSGTHGCPGPQRAKARERARAKARRAKEKAPPPRCMRPSSGDHHWAKCKTSGQAATMIGGQIRGMVPQTGLMPASLCPYVQ